MSNTIDIDIRELGALGRIVRGPGKQASSVPPPGEIRLNETGRNNAMSKLNLNELRETAARANDAYLAERRRIAISEAGYASEAEYNRAQRKEADKRFARVMESGMTKMHKMGRRILIEGRSAFDPLYNSRTKGEQVTGGMGSLPPAA